MRVLLALSLALAALLAGCERPHSNPSVAAAPAAAPVPIPPLGAPTVAAKLPSKVASEPHRTAAADASLRRGESRPRADARQRERNRTDAELCPDLVDEALDHCLALEERRLGGAPARGDEQALRDFREAQAQRDRELFDQDANPGYGPDPGLHPRQAQLPPAEYDLPPEYDELPPDYNDEPPYYDNDNDLPPDEQFIP
ncbi:MAG: hypothetical protein ABIW30_06660 [Arenimonas sp.]